MGEIPQLKNKLTSSSGWARSRKLRLHFLALRQTLKSRFGWRQPTIRQKLFLVRRWVPINVVEAMTKSEASQMIADIRAGR